MSFFNILKESFHEWSEDAAPRMAAALAYFALFAMAPLLLIAISVAGLVFGEAAVKGEVSSAIEGTIGPRAAQMVGEMIAAAGEKKGEGIFALIGGIVMLLLGASGLFAHLKAVLNKVWEVPEPEKKGILASIIERLWSFGMVLSVGFLLLVSLLLSAALAAAGTWFSGVLPLNEWVWHTVNFLVSLGVITVLFAAIYKYIPDAEIAWRDVWAGAAFTALLFVLGKFAIGLYLGKTSAASAYGAAGSVVILLLWLYYSGLIVLFGAEFTEVWARKHHGLTTRADRRKQARSSA